MLGFDLNLKLNKESISTGRSTDKGHGKQPGLLNCLVVA
jgi:hypothetical protein